MIRAIRSRGPAAALLLSLVLLAGATACSSPSREAPSTAAPPTSSPSTAAPPTGPSTAPPTGAGSACDEVVARGNDVAAAVRALVDGQGSRDQVTAAVQELGTAVNAARASASSARAQALDDVQAAAGELLSTLQTQPIDLAAVQAAAQKTVTALGALGQVCATDTPATPTATS